MPYSFDFRRKLKENRWKDAWWVYVGEETLSDVHTLDEAVKLLEGYGEGTHVYLINVAASQVEGEDWELLEVLSPAKKGAQSQHSKGEVKVKINSDKWGTYRKEEQEHPFNPDDPITDSQRAYIVDHSLVALRDINSLTSKQAARIIRKYKRRSFYRAMSSVFFVCFKAAAFLLVCGGLAFAVIKYELWNYFDDEPEPEVVAEVEKKSAPRPKLNKFYIIEGSLEKHAALTRHVGSDVQLVLVERFPSDVKGALSDITDRYFEVLEGGSVNKPRDFAAELNGMVDKVPMPAMIRQRDRPSQSGVKDVYVGEAHYDRLVSKMKAARIESLLDTIDSMKRYIEREEPDSIGDNYTDVLAAYRGWQESCGFYFSKLEQLHAEYVTERDQAKLALEAFKVQAQETNHLVETYLSSTDYVMLLPGPFGSFEQRYDGKNDIFRGRCMKVSLSGTPLYMPLDARLAYLSKFSVDEKFEEVAPVVSGL